MTSPLPNMKKPWPLLRVVLIVGALLLLAAAVVILREPLLVLFSNPTRLREAVLQWGILAPLLIIALHVFQVLLSPLPGQPVGLASGYLFGAVKGALYSLTGIVLGSTILFWLSRRYGRPLVERLVDRELLDRLDDHFRRKGLSFLLIVYWLPFMPDDIICLVAGLTPLPLTTLFILAVVGRLPGTLIVNLVGANALHLSGGWLAVLLTALALIAALSYRYQEILEEMMFQLLERGK